MEIENYSIPAWIIKNNIKNEKGELFEFKDHLFLFDYLCDNSQNICGKKCSQIGGSVSENLKTFHYADKQKITTIYTMPSDSDVEEFSKTKTDKIFQANDCIKSKLLLDNVGLKQINDTFVYFKGTRSKAAPISTTADRLVHDELDRSDMNIVESYSSRTADSKHKKLVLLSNPSFYNVGIDLAWKKSDKKEWFIRCTGCGEKQTLTYDENIDEIRKVFVCSKCNKVLTDIERRLGFWEPTATLGEHLFSGYHFSHLMYVRHTAEEIIRNKHTKSIEFFRNFVLGEPYSSGDVTDFRQIITDNWVPEPIDEGQFYMGIDIGKEKHWALGTEKGIFKIGKCESREELSSVIERYNPIIVMDSGPERTWAEEFKQKYPKLSICFYNHNTSQQAEMIKWGGEKNTEDDYKNIGYVWIDRNRVIDGLVYDMMRGDIVYNLNREDMDKLIEHWMTMSRIEEDTPQGGKRYVWVTSTGVNHYCSAMWFYWIARKKAINPTIVISSTRDKKEIIFQDKDGFKMRSLREIIENEE